MALSTARVIEWLHENNLFATLAALESELANSSNIFHADLDALLTQGGHSEALAACILKQIMMEQLAAISSKQDVVKYLAKFNAVKPKMDPELCASLEACLLTDSPIDHPLFAGWSRHKGRKALADMMIHSTKTDTKTIEPKTETKTVEAKKLINKAKKNQIGPVGIYSDIGKHPIRVASFSHDGKFVAVGTNSQSLVLCDRGMAVVGRNDLIHSGSVYTLGWSPDDKWIATGSNDQSIRLTNVSQLCGLGHVATPTRLQLQAGTVRTLAYLNADQIVAGCSGDPLIRCLDIGSQKLLWTSSSNAPMSVIHSISVDTGGLVCFATSAGLVSVLDHREPSELIYSIKGQVASVADMNQGLIAIGTESGDVSLYDMRRGVVPIWQRENAHAASCRSVAVNETFVASVSFDKTGILFDAVSGKTAHVLSEHTDRVVHVEWNPTRNDQLVTCGADARAILWNV